MRSPTLEQRCRICPHPIEAHTEGSGGILRQIKGVDPPIFALGPCLAVIHVRQILTSTTGFSYPCPCHAGHVGESE